MGLMDGDCRTDGIYIFIENTEWMVSAKHGSEKETAKG